MERQPKGDTQNLPGDLKIVAPPNVAWCTASLRKTMPEHAFASPLFLKGWSLFSRGDNLQGG